MSRIDKTTDQTSGKATAALPRFEFLAGRLALDFCNTHSRVTGGDRLADAAGLAAWAERGDRPLVPPPVAADLARFRDLRAHLCRLFDAILDGTGPAQPDLDAVAAAARPRLAGLRWDSVRGQAIPLAAADASAQLHADIAADAVDLLTGPAVARIKRCPGEVCRWFFFDATRNGRRRWCAMADCGTRAKVRQFRNRRRGATPAF